jgi:hypothetical protein
MNRTNIAYPLSAKLLLLCLSLVFGFAMFEIALRIASIQYPYFTYFTEPDPILGYALRPNAEGWQTYEGKAYVHMNTAGMRDVEREREKPDRTVRIAVVGDSVAEAPQVPLEQTFWSVTEAALKTCPAIGERPAEILNFGVSGYSNLQELLVIKERVWVFDPDIVLLTFFSGNDLRENMHTHKGMPYRPSAVPSGQSFSIDNAFRETPFYQFRTSVAGDTLLRFITQSRTLQVVNKARLVALKKYREYRRGGLKPEEIGLDSWVYRPPQDEHERAQWQVTEAILEEAAKEVHQRGATFLIVIATNGSQVHPFPETRKRYEDELGVSDLFYPDRRIEELGRREGFPVLSLAPFLQPYAEEHQLFLHGFPNTQLGTGHWNAEGHIAAGERIADFLCSSVLP